jgi:hypothetical protein
MALNGVERIQVVSNGDALTSTFGVDAGQGVGVDRVHTEEVTGSIPVSPTQLTGHFPSMEMAFLLAVQQQRTAVALSHRGCLPGA